MTQPTSDQSDTPKTDAAMIEILGGDFVTVDFARELERQLDCAVHVAASLDQKRRITELEEALALIPKIVNDAYEAWDSDNDSRVGKILRALAGRLPLYREDTSKVVAVIQTVTKS